MNQSVIISPISESLKAFLVNTNYSKVFVITDKNTRKYCYPKIKSALPKHHVVTVPAGEEHKVLASCEKIWEEMTNAQLDRHALVLNIGGGVIGDMGGFCAAVYKRGIDFIQIPTTLLSQVDASVGGKLGIDFRGLKNHIGVFQIPKSVLIDPAFLDTLSYRELRSGFGEVIKHCLIADSKKWEAIRTIDFEKQQWADLIAHSVKIKQEVVDKDPKEKGLRKILNFGHTLGHAVETHFLSKDLKFKLLHGEAIAVGMVMEAFIAFQRKMIDQKLLSQIEEFVFATYGKTNLGLDDIEPILELTHQDKKNRGNQIRFSLLDGAGSCAFDVVVSKTEMRKAIAYYMA
tara:strand:+ start:98 stop:1132 length:1035 start_codon:yes stop_codon:yes gene_type:complete